MRNWVEVSLADVCGRPQYGAIAKGSAEPVGPRFVRQTDIASGRIKWDSLPFCDLDRFEFDKYAIKGGDLLISRLGAGVGTAAMVQETHGAVFAGYLVRFQADQMLAAPEYLSHQLHSAAWRHHVNGFRSGAAQPTLNALQMGAFRFALPPMQEQLGISATLDALDDKIESNRRATKLIDQLTRSITWRWRERSLRVSRTTFGDFADVYGGATPKTAVPDYWDGGFAWTTPTDVTRLSAPYLFSTTRTITPEGLASCTAALHPAGTIFMTSRATIGAFAVNQVPAATNQGFIAVRPRRDVERWFLFEEMRSRVPEFLDNANGSTFLEISRGNFKRLPLAVPGDRDLVELDELLDPLHRKGAQLTSQSERLAGLRDVLLPELLSGRLRVPEAAEAIQEAAG